MWKGLPKGVSDLLVVFRPLELEKANCRVITPGYPSPKMPYTRQGSEGEDLYRCSGCHMWHFSSGFLVNRLGRRYKTCTSCCAREKDPVRLAKKKAASDSRQLSRPACRWLSDSDLEALLT